jgi:hypothetical protein
MCSLPGSAVLHVHVWRQRAGRGCGARAPEAGSPARLLARCQERPQPCGARAGGAGARAGTCNGDTTCRDDFYSDPTAIGYYKDHVKMWLNRRNTLTGRLYRCGALRAATCAAPGSAPAECGDRRQVYGVQVAEAEHLSLRWLSMLVWLHHTW